MRSRLWRKICLFLVLLGSLFSIFQIFVTIFFEKDEKFQFVNEDSFFSRQIAKNVIRNFHFKGSVWNDLPSRIYRVGEYGGFGNTLMGWTNALVFCYIAGCVPMIDFSLGANVKGDFFDYYSLRNRFYNISVNGQTHFVDLLKYMSYSEYRNCEKCKIQKRKSEKVTIKFETDQLSHKIHMRNFYLTDPEIMSLKSLNCVDRNKKSAIKGIPRCKEWDEEAFLHYPFFFVGNIKGNKMSYEKFYFGERNFRNFDVVINSENILFPFFINYSRKLLRNLCFTLNLCREYEQVAKSFLSMGDLDFERYQKFKANSKMHYAHVSPEMLYLSFRIAGLLFNEMFVLKPNYKNEFDAFISNKVKGMLIVLQVRTLFFYDKKTDSKKMHYKGYVPNAQKWINCVRKLIHQYSTTRTEFTIFISIDKFSFLEQFIKSLSHLKNEFSHLKIHILSMNDYLPPGSDISMGDDFIQKSHQSNNINLIKGLLFDVEMMKESDVNLISAGSTFGYFFAGRNSKFYPPLSMIDTTNKKGKKAYEYAVTCETHKY